LNWQGILGKEIATNALQEFLKLISIRPLYARAAKDNEESLKVLKKCGFMITDEDIGFSNTRGEDVEEFILTLILRKQKVFITIGLFL